MPVRNNFFLATKNLIFCGFWAFSSSFLHLNRQKNDFLGTPQKTRIFVKISENLLFFLPCFGSPEVEISEWRSSYGVSASEILRRAVIFSGEIDFPKKKRFFICHKMIKKCLKKEKWHQIRPKSPH